MFVLTGEITIAGRRFSAVNDIQIKRSVYQLGASAKIKIPITAILKSQIAPPTWVQVAQEVRVGDSVQIKLGYNGRLYNEFVGYVKAVNLATPIEIECEDEFWLTRKRSLTTSGTTTLSDLLAKCELKVGFAEELTLRNFIVPSKPVSSVLSKLKSDYGLSIFFDLQGQVYACRPERVVGDKVKYELRQNVINDDNLQYKSRADVQLQIKAVCFNRDGTKIEATRGSGGGAERTLYFYDVTSLNELAALADHELKRYSYDGYDGTITTFLEPYVAPTMIADLVDPIYPERTGRYYIEAVETTFNKGGARRKIEIGATVDGTN